MIIYTTKFVFFYTFLKPSPNRHFKRPHRISSLSSFLGLCQSCLCFITRGAITFFHLRGNSISSRKLIKNKRLLATFNLKFKNKFTFQDPLVTFNLKFKNCRIYFSGSPSFFIIIISLEHPSIHKS